MKRVSHAQRAERRKALAARYKEIKTGDTRADIDRLAKEFKLSYSWIQRALKAQSVELPKPVAEARAIRLRGLEILADMIKLESVMAAVKKHGCTKQYAYKLRSNAKDAGLFAAIESVTGCRLKVQ